MLQLNTPSKKVIIIGNGFDLNLGLKTSYKDFIASKIFIDLFRPHSIFAYLYEKQQINNWIDVEIELKRYSVSFDDKYFKEDYNKLCNALINYMNSIDYNVLDTNSHSYKLIQSLRHQDYFIFDFNYTNTLHNIAMKIGYDSLDIENRTLKMHGSAPDKKIIFGVEDSARINENHQFIRKTYPIFYQSVNLDSKLISAEEIFMFGHSLGETDHVYFSNFFRQNSVINHNGVKKKIYFYHYGDEGYNSLYQQIFHLTSNQMKFFKQNCLIEYIDSSIPIK